MAIVRGLDSPLVRWMLSGGQTGAVNKSINKKGIGVQSTAQRIGTGNKFQSLEERRNTVAASRRIIAPGKKAKKGKKRGPIGHVAPGNEQPTPEVGINPPVQLPTEPDEEDLGLASSL